MLSPLACRADLHFVVSAKGNGPFDSYVGPALAGVLVAGVADRLRTSATESLDRIELAWSEAGADDFVWRTTGNRVLGRVGSMRRSRLPVSMVD